MSKGSSPTSPNFPEDLLTQPHQRSRLGNKTPTQEDLDRERVRSASPRDSSRRRAQGRPTSLDSQMETRDFESAPGPSNNIGSDIEKHSEDSSYELAWPRQAALSFDGGGIRGYASLLMLQRLMKEVVNCEQKHPNGPHSSSFDIDKPKTEFTTCKRQKAFNPKSGPPNIARDAEPPVHKINEREHAAETNANAEASELGAGRINQPKQNNEDGENEKGESTLPPENAFLPCHYFDYVAGTSTGGLIAIMLGRLRMPVDQCLQQYEVFGKQIFGSPRALSLKGVPFDKYSSKPLVTALQDLTMRKTPESNKKELPVPPLRRIKKSWTGKPLRPDTLDSAKSMKPSRKGKDAEQLQSQSVAYETSGRCTFSSPEDLCKVIAISVEVKEKHQNHPYMFRSYAPFFPGIKDFRREGSVLRNTREDNSETQIWEVGRATTAAPTYFKPIKIGDAEYIDGAMEANNPSLELWREITARTANRGPTIVANPFQVFVSFGTGKPAKSGGLAVSRSSRLVKPIKKLVKIGQYSIKRLTEAERTHDTMNNLFQNSRDRYHRFNVDDPVLGTVELDEWIEGKKGKDDTLVFIRQVVDEEFENNPSIQDDLQKCAELLVNLRRDRATASSRVAAARWERFSKCIRFKCPDCSHPYYDRVDFCTHLTEKHRTEWQKPSEHDEEGMARLNERLDRYISGPKYQEWPCIGPW